MPIYQNNNTDHYLIIIEKQLEQDKQLYAKFVQQLQEFTYFNIQQQFDYQLILTKLENLNEDEISNQQCVQNDLEIVYLQYQINSFLTESKEFSLNEKLKQLLSNRGYLKDVQESLIENVYSVQDRLQEQYQKSRAEQGISEFNTETKIEYLETLKAKLNSVSLCNQVKKEILVQIDNATASLVKEINQYKQNIAQLEQTNQKLQQETLSSIFSNSYQPQFNSSYKFSAFSLVSPKLVQASSGGFGLAVMQPPLPKDKITQFIIKINKFNDWAGVGVCHLQTAQSFNYNMSANYQSTNHNTYIACAGGYRISSFQGYTGNQFTFRENSFLCCSYNSITYKLTLIHLNDGKTYEMDITKNSLEMSPCVILYGSAQIEII
ncbi:unnamed protein product [Paramecium octaurelia]|uniref:Uncharacterized protein n=1 Tax=Paramecium octaurelia TaxID=43137 RepID=A0A8S1X6P2_PAROT|nr:unnamed protein product [Paramecium octaurelia]